MSVEAKERYSKNYITKSVDSGKICDKIKIATEIKDKKLLERGSMDSIKDYPIVSLVIDGQSYDLKDGEWELDRLIDLYRYPNDYANYDGLESVRMVKVAGEFANGEELSKLAKLVKSSKAAAEQDDAEKVEKLNAEVEKLVLKITNPKGLSVADKITLLSLLEDNLRYLYHQKDNTVVKVVYASKLEK